MTLESHHPPEERSLEAIEMLIASFHTETIKRLNECLESLEGMRFSSKEEALEEIRRIRKTVRSAGCVLTYMGETVTVGVVTVPRHKHSIIQVRSRKDGRRVILKSSTRMPKFSAKAQEFTDKGS